MLGWSVGEGLRHVVTQLPSTKRILSYMVRLLLLVASGQIRYPIQTECHFSFVFFFLVELVLVPIDKYAIRLKRIAILVFSLCGGETIGKVSQNWKILTNIVSTK